MMVVLSVSLCIVVVIGVLVIFMMWVSASMVME